MLLLDFAKANDALSLEFILAALSRAGLPARFVRAVRRLHETGNSVQELTGRGYADDIALYVADTSNAEAAMTELVQFSNASGLLANVSKSVATPLGRAATERCTCDDVGRQI